MSNFARVILCIKIMITVEEYKQFKAFTRQDGAFIGVLMSVAFLIFVKSFTNPSMQMLYLLCMVAVPMVAALRVRNYRDKIVMKRISKRRAFGYCLSCFMYGSLVLALSVFVYFQFFDNGAFLASLNEYFAMPEMKVAMETYGLNQADMKEQLNSLSELRPVDVALSVITNTFTIGICCSLFIALLSRREPRVVNN